MRADPFGVPLSDMEGKHIEYKELRERNIRFSSKYGIIKEGGNVFFMIQERNVIMLAPTNRT